MKSISLRKSGDTLIHKSRIAGFLGKTAVYLILICLSYIILYPFVIKVFGSLRGVEDIGDYTVVLIPKHFTLENLKLAFDGLKYPKALLNSVLLSGMVGVLQVFSTATVGYGLSRFRFPGRNLIYALVLITLMIPAQTTMTATFLQFRYFDIFGLFNLILGHPLNLISTPVPFAILAITGFGLRNGLYIYLATQSFRGLPRELDDAASVDGAGAIRIFRSVMLPNVIPILLTIFLFSFCWQWTDSYYSSLFVKSWDLLARNIQMIMNALSYMEVIEVSAVRNAGMILIILPLLLVYVISQKYFISGITNSGIVG